MTASELAPFVPVLDVGGTHVTACTVDPAGWTLAEATVRRELDGSGSAHDILAVFADACAALAVPVGAVYAVAMPDPFDYWHGIGRFRDVGKFESLDGVDVRAELLQALPGRPRDVVFCNDADAFALGEWVDGAATSFSSVVGITLGTGVGSGWVRDGQIVIPDSPPDGRAHRLEIDGRPLEDTMSRRAIRRAYARAGGDAAADVAVIAARASEGDRTAIEVLRHALTALGSAIAPGIRAFGADVVVVGGSMTGSWSLFEAWLSDGAGALPPVRLAADAERAPLLGAAFHAAVSPPR